MKEDVINKTNKIVDSISKIVESAATFVKGVISPTMDLIEETKEKEKKDK